MRFRLANQKLLKNAPGSSRENRPRIPQPRRQVTHLTIPIPHAASCYLLSAFKNGEYIPRSEREISSSWLTKSIAAFLIQSSLQASSPGTSLTPPLQSAPYERILISSAYSFLVRRNYVFLGVIFAGSFGFEMYVGMLGNNSGIKQTDQIYRAYDTVTDRVWDNINKGVSGHCGNLQAGRRDND